MTTQDNELPAGPRHPTDITRIDNQAVTTHHSWIPARHTESVPSWELVDENGSLVFQQHLTDIIAEDTSASGPEGVLDEQQWTQRQMARESLARQRAVSSMKQPAIDEGTAASHHAVPEPFLDLYGRSRQDACLAVQAGMVPEPTAGDTANWSQNRTLRPVGRFSAVLTAFAAMFGSSAMFTVSLTSQAGDTGSSFFTSAVTTFIMAVLIAGGAGVGITIESAGRSGPRVIDDAGQQHRGFNGGRHTELAKLMRQVHHTTATTDHGGVDDPLWDLWESVTELADEATTVPSRDSQGRYDEAIGQIVEKIHQVIADRAGETLPGVGAARDVDADPEILAELEEQTAQLSPSAADQQVLQSYLDSVVDRARQV